MEELFNTESEQIDDFSDDENTDEGYFSNNQTHIQVNVAGEGIEKGIEEGGPKSLNQKTVVPDLKDAIEHNERLEISHGIELDIFADPPQEYDKEYFVLDSSDAEDEISSHIIGNPEVDKENWHQQKSPDTCAIVSQEFIIESFKDEDLTENELVNQSIEKGYYSPGSGTSPWDVGKLLEDFDIPVERTAYRSFDDIIEKLKNNHKIIVGVDANEIWENSDEQQLLDLFFMPQANHAVQVIGFDSDQEKVILNDSGHPDGKGMRVSLSDFSNAWEDSNNFMVYTKEPAPISSIA